MVYNGYHRYEDGSDRNRYYLDQAFGRETQCDQRERSLKCYTNRSASSNRRDSAQQIATSSPHRHPAPRLERWERRLSDAKKAHRPRLLDWERGRFGVEGSTACAAFETLASSRDERAEARGLMPMPRERREELSKEEFWEHYERRRVPVIVSGIPWHEGWKAGERWTFERLDRRRDALAVLFWCQLRAVR